MDHCELATSLLRKACGRGADAADVLVAWGEEFSVSVRNGDVETLEEAGSKALGLRVFVGRRTATGYTSDFSASALAALVEETVGMARATGEDEAAGLPDECPPFEDVDLDLFDPSPMALSPAERIDRAKAGEAAALCVPGITQCQSAGFSCGEGSVVLANTLGFVGTYRSSSASLSVVPQAARDSQMERDYWYTTGRGLADLESPEEVGRIAAERTLRRLGARRVKTCEVPIVFDPETAAELLGTLYGALSGAAVFRSATFLKDRLGEQVASPLLTIIDDGRIPRGLGSRPFDGEGLATRRNVPLEDGVVRFFPCDAYSARKLGTRPTGSARRGVSGGPSVGSANLCFAAGESSPGQILGEVKQGLYVTDLIGFGVNIVSGDYSQGAVGHWIENGSLTHPVHEVTIAGNLRDMLMDVDAVGSDLVWRGSRAAPTLRIRRMTVSGE